MTTLRLCAFSCALVFIVSCGGGLSGEYSDSSGLFKYDFKSGGKVEMTSMGATVELDYKVEDGKVKLGPAGTQMVLALGKDGCIEGIPFVGKLCKAKSK